MKLISYFRDVKTEFKHIEWLTRREVFWYTVGVVVVCFLIAYYLGALDGLFTRLLNELVN
jgi:preprotein translocase subunit SecE